MTVRHPASFTEHIIPMLAAMSGPAVHILDAFGGLGKTGQIEKYRPTRVVCLELEPAWAMLAVANCNRQLVGNALRLPFADGEFDGLVTSPTFGNRMADNFNSKDGSKRVTYRHCLGQELSPDNSGGMQWGPAYCQFHKAAWSEAYRVLCPQAVFVLHIKDHIRNGQQVLATEWHLDTLQELGFALDYTIDIPAPGCRFGANYDKRVDHETLARLVRQ